MADFFFLFFFADLLRRCCSVASSPVLPLSFSSLLRPAAAVPFFFLFLSFILPCPSSLLQWPVWACGFYVKLIGCFANYKFISLSNNIHVVFYAHLIIYVDG